MLMVNLVYSVYSVAVFKRDKRTSSLVNAVNMRIARAPVLAAAERPRETETPWQKAGTARRRDFDSDLAVECPAGCTPRSPMILHCASSTPYTDSLSGSDELTVE